MRPFNPNDPFNSDNPFNTTHLYLHRPSMKDGGFLDEIVGDYLGLFSSANCYVNHLMGDYNENMISDHKKEVSDKHFRAQLDVSQFAPNEIKIIVAGRNLIIDGKHEERRDDYGFISRSFTRRYELPDDVDEQKMACKLSSEGKLLKLEAPKKEAIKDTPNGEMIAIENGPGGLD